MLLCWRTKRASRELQESLMALAAAVLSVLRWRQCGRTSLLVARRIKPPPVIVAAGQQPPEAVAELFVCWLRHRAQRDGEWARRRWARRKWVTQPTEIQTVPTSDVEGRSCAETLLTNTLAKPAQSIAHISLGVWEAFLFLFQEGKHSTCSTKYPCESCCPTGCLCITHILSFTEECFFSLRTISEELGFHSRLQWTHERRKPKASNSNKKRIYLVPK